MVLLKELDLKSKIVTEKKGTRSDIENLEEEYELIPIGSLNGNQIILSNLKKKIILINKKDFIIKTSKNQDYHRDLSHNTIYLHTTMNCNMNCKYCSVCGGDMNYRMNLGLFKKTIDYFISLFNDKISFEFGTLGESTFDFKILKKGVHYIKKKNSDIKIGITTNGIFNEKICNWLIKNFDIIRISIDGPPEIQDKQRPLKNGKASSPYVERTIKRLIEKNKGFTTSSVITNLSIGKEEKIIKYFHNLGIKRVNFSNLIRRGKGKKFQPLPVKKLTNSFLKMNELGEELGLRIDFNILRGLGAKFPRSCRQGNIFFVSPKGTISSCFYFIEEKNDDPVSPLREFLIGEYNNKSGTFNLKKERIEDLKGIEMKRCESCDFFPICANGCPLSNLERDSEIIDYKCSLIKQRYKKYFTYQAKKYFLRKKPYLEYKDGKFYFKLFFNDFKLDKIENDVANGSSFIQITNLKKLDDILEKIKYLKPIDKIDLFLLSFHLQKSEFNLSTGKKIIEFLNSLKKSKKYFKVTKPLPKRCLFGENWEKIFEKYEIPKTCFECLELFFLENNDIIFCNGKKGGKFDEAKDRREIYDKFIELKTRKEPENCNDCIYKIRKSCDGIWYS